MRIKIVQGKRAKDSFTILPQQVLQELRAYYIIYKPIEYLFNGYKPGKHYNVRSIEHLMQTTLAKIGLESKNYTVHTLRHPASGGARHLADNGTDLHTVKELPGHRNLQTTMRFLHLSPKRIANIVNPYDVLPQGKENNQHH